MSALSSNSPEREFEGARRAQRALEPSMEEILASIRTIIADDRDGAKPAAVRAPSPRPAPGPQIVYAREDLAAPEAEPEEGREPDIARAFAAVAERAAAWRRGDRVDPAPEEAPEGEPLLSAEASGAAASAFEALSANLAERAAEIADEAVRATLRPMLKAWLDENLPAIVERLVRSEIERIGRVGPVRGQGR